MRPGQQSHRKWCWGVGHGKVEEEGPRKGTYSAMWEAHLTRLSYLIMLLLQKSSIVRPLRIAFIGWHFYFIVGLQRSLLPSVTLIKWRQLQCSMGMGVCKEVRFQLAGQRGERSRVYGDVRSVPQPQRSGRHQCYQDCDMDNVQTPPDGSLPAPRRWTFWKIFDKPSNLSIEPRVEISDRF